MQFKVFIHRLQDCYKCNILEHKNESEHIKAINATECGYNALDELLDVIDTSGSDLSIILEHKNDLEKCKEREYLINDTREIKSLLWL